MSTKWKGNIIFLKRKAETIKMQNKKRKKKRKKSLSSFYHIAKKKKNYFLYSFEVEDRKHIIIQK